MHHAFLYISLPSLHDYDVKMPNFTMYRGGTYISMVYTLTNHSSRPISSRGFAQLLYKIKASRLCIKVGRGQGDGDIGTCVCGTWDLGTRDEGLEDIKYGARGRDVWDGEAGTSDTGTQGARDVNDYCKCVFVTSYTK